MATYKLGRYNQITNSTQVDLLMRLEKVVPITTFKLTGGGANMGAYDSDDSKLMVYDRFGNRIALSDARSSVNSGWNTYTFSGSNQIILYAGQTYWIGFLPQYNVTKRIIAGSLPSGTSKSSTRVYPTPPVHWSTSTWTDDGVAEFFYVSGPDYGLPVGYTPIPLANCSIEYVDSEETSGEDGAADNVLDGDPQTFWSTSWSGDPDPGQPHEIQIDLGQSYNVGALQYLPRQGSTSGRVRQYEIYVSDSTSSWGTAVATGTFDPDDVAPQVVTFSGKTGRYVRFVTLSSYDYNYLTTVAELQAFSIPVTTPKKILYVHAEGRPDDMGTLSDLAAVERLRDMGYNVTTIQDDEVVTADATGYDLVWISATVSSGNITDKFKSVSIPVVASENAIADDMGFCYQGVGGTDFSDLADQYIINIDNASHALAGGLSSGQVTICSTSADFFHWAKPGGDVVSIASIDGDSTKKVIFAYEQGDDLDDGTQAAGRRVFFGFGNDVLYYANANGLALFDAAVDYALNGSGTSQDESGTFSLTATAEASASGTAQEQASGSFSVEATGALAATGTPLETPSGSFSAAGASAIVASGAAEEQASGNFSIGATAEIIASGSGSQAAEVELIDFETVAGAITGDNSITVPTDCELVVISYSFFSNANDMVSASLDGDAFTKAVSIQGVAGLYGTAGQWYLVNPSTGAQTLTTTFQNNSDVGHFAVTYWKNVNTASPIRGSDLQQAASSQSAYQTITSDAMDCEPGDVGLVVCFCSSTQSDPDAAPTGSGQTEIVDSLCNAHCMALGYKNITTSGTTTMQGAGSYPSLAAIIIAAAAGGAEGQANGSFELSATGTLEISGLGAEAAGGIANVTAISSLAAVGAPLEQAAGSISIEATGEIAATGTPAETPAGTFSLTGVGSLAATGTAWMGGAPVSDDFAGASLDEGLWSIIDPLDDCGFSIVQAADGNRALQITVPSSPSHDMFGSTLNAAQVVQDVGDVDFSIRTKMLHALSGAYQIAGLIIRGAGTNEFIRFDFYSTGTGVNQFVRYQGPEGDATYLSEAATYAAPMHIRIDRAGDQFTCYKSTNGTNWTQVAQFTKAFTVAKVGVFAGSINLAFTAKFDHFIEAADPIAHEDGDDWAGTFAVTAASSITATGTARVAVTGTFSLSAVANISATGQGGDNASGNFSVAATGALAASGTAREQAAGAANVTGTGTITAAGTAYEINDFVGQLVVEAISSIEAAGTPLETVSGGFILEASAIITATGGEVIEGYLRMILTAEVPVIEITAEVPVIEITRGEI